MEIEPCIHKPVMLREVIEYLNLTPGKLIVDATIGMGGHSQMILEHIMPGGRLIGIDRDEESLRMAKERLAAYADGCEFVHANFCDIDRVLKNLNITHIDGIVFDLGISSYQMADVERGFSFQEEGPLDMRMDRTSYISAYDLLNNLTEEEISSLLWNFGQERWHNRIARLLVQERERHPISTTKELARIVLAALPGKYRFRHHRIHPATRTFQAVRIAVNRELENLESAIKKSIDVLAKNARMCIISFHSLEDRIVKVNFRQASSDGRINILTPKPLTPLLSEIECNPSSRSAKFRSAEISTGSGE